MHSLFKSQEFIELEEKFPFLRRAREVLSGLKGLDCVIVDIETTGLDYEQCEIIEVAALKISAGEIKDVFCSLINIQQPLSQEIINLTGITDDMLLEGRGKKDVLRDVYDFVGDRPLLAHNVEFDIPFLNHHLDKELGLNFQNPLICTLKLSRKLLPGLSSHRLGKVAEYFKLLTPNTHRASGDVEITHQVWLKLIDLLERAGVNTLEELQQFAPPLA